MQHAGVGAAAPLREADVIELDRSCELLQALRMGLF
jgi:hypothetical protein